MISFFLFPQPHDIALEVPGLHRLSLPERGQYGRLVLLFNALQLRCGIAFGGRYRQFQSTRAVDPCLDEKVTASVAVEHQPLAFV
jgi:hypothetical protein